VQTGENELSRLPQQQARKALAEIDAGGSSARREAKRRIFEGDSRRS
jgi:hypothetical protein